MNKRMKVLIWIGCVFAYSLIVTFLSYSGIVLGGIPTMLLAAVVIFLPARTLCKKWDERHPEPNDGAPGVQQNASNSTTDSAERRDALVRGQRPEALDFGYDPSNPILTASVQSSAKYLSRLATSDGEPLDWLRMGWVSLKECDGVPDVIVDKYCLYFHGEKYGEIYVCPYGLNGNYAPNGLILLDGEFSDDRGDIERSARKEGVSNDQYIQYLKLLYQNQKMQDDVKTKQAEPVEELCTQDELPALEDLQILPPILFCRKCGSKLLPESDFCSKCGTPVIKGEEK